MNGDELVKQESVTKKSRKVSVTKITHGSENPPNVKKQIKKKISRHSILQHCLFMNFICTFETGSVKWQILRSETHNFG